MSKRTLEERFWEKVDKSGDCWEWTASKGTAGYGQIADGHRRLMAHRASYEMTYGPIPKGMQIDHKCHNRACVKPDHLRAVTVKQNAENVLGAKSNSKSGIRGVIWDRRTGKWHGQVIHNYRVHRTSYFPTIAEANAAVIAKRNELFTHNDADRIPTRKQAS